MDDFLVLDSLYRRYGGKNVVGGISLTIRHGEIFSLLGPSGCGKTTLLRMIAGLDQPDTGRILLENRDLTHLPAHRRPVNTVFQNYALFPHLTVAENIAFGLVIAKRNKSEISKEVDRMLDLVRLSGSGAKRPSQLSGGEKQRVAIARALVNQPQVLLLDEPLAALDLKLRQHLLIELKALHHQVHTTFIYVTHDQGEAMSLSHRIAVLHAGKVEQVGTPHEIYELPHTAQVASFIGNTNFLPVLHSSPGTPFWQAEVSGIGQIHARPPIKQNAKSLKISIRPEKIRFSRNLDSGANQVNTIPATISGNVYFGTHTMCLADAGGHPFTFPLPQHESVLRQGEPAWLSFDPEHTLLLDAAPA